jgi:hypothetical protein
VARKKAGHLSYDAGVSRFRDSRGRFVSYTKGIRSSTARTEYYSTPVARRYVPKKKPRKKLIAPLKPRIIPPSKLPDYFEGAVYVGPDRQYVPNQTMIEGIARWGIMTLANLIHQQIQKGFIRFRFWYKVVKSGFIYTDTTRSGSKIGSTGPIMNNVIAYNGTLTEVISFLQGRGNFINGKVVYYWISKRLG